MISSEVNQTERGRDADLYIITDPYQIPLFSLCNISAIAASTFYQEQIWYSSVIIIDNYFGQTALLNILQPASPSASCNIFNNAVGRSNYLLNNWIAHPVTKIKPLETNLQYQYGRHEGQHLLPTAKLPSLLSQLKL